MRFAQKQIRQNHALESMAFARRAEDLQASLLLHSEGVTRFSQDCKEWREQVTVNPLSKANFIHRCVSGPSAATAVFGTSEKPKNTQLMNIKTIGTTALLALAGALLAPSTSNAALAYTDGDLFLGFRNATTSYVVNIGPATNLINATTPITLSIGNTKADLDNLMSGWANSSSVLWGLVGIKNTANAGLGFPVARTLFASNANTAGILGTQGSVAWPRGSLAAHNTPIGQFNELRSVFTAASATANSTVAMSGLNSDINSWRSYQPGGDPGNSTATAAFLHWNGGIEASFATGTTGAYLDIYDIRVDSTASNLPADFLGSLSINSSNGTVTFTPEGVPEPTTVTALGLGLAMLITRRRRQTA